MDVTQSELVGVGLVLAFATATWSARRRHVDVIEVFAVLGLAGVASAVGARLWSLVEWQLTDTDAVWVWDPFAPAGYASGGAILGVGSVLIAHRLLVGSDEFARVVDVVTPAGFLAFAFARAGCFVEGCDYGGPTSASWGVAHNRGHGVFDAHVADGLVGADASMSLAVHPFGLYIAIPLTIVCVGALLWRHRTPGLTAAIVLVAYGLIRFAAEWTRAEGNRALDIGPMHVGHVIAGGAVLVGTVYLVLRLQDGGADALGSASTDT